MINDGQSTGKADYSSEVQKINRPLVRVAQGEATTYTVSNSGFSPFIRQPLGFFSRTEDEAGRERCSGNTRVSRKQTGHKSAEQ